MEKNNGKIIAVLALIVAVVALSVGFAAFTTSLTIEGNAVAKTGEDTVFAPNVNYASTPVAKCYKTSDSTASVITEGYSAGLASAKQWSGIKVPLDSTNSYDVTCEAVIENASAYTAYLTTITSSGNNDGKLSCAAVDSGTSQLSATNVCTGTNVTVSLGSSSGTITSASAITNPTISNTSIAANDGTDDGTLTVTVRIKYTGAAPDGDVSITIPTINLGFSTVAP